MFKLLEAMAAGVVTVCKLEGEDSHLLAVRAKDKGLLVVPMLKSARGALAYIDDDIPEEDCKRLTEIFEAINAKGVYKGIYKYTPAFGKAPEHSHNVVDVLRGATGSTTTVAPSDLKDQLAAAGYTWVEKELSVSTVKRDYSALLADPTVKQAFDEDAEELARVGATYAKLDDEIKIAYEAIESGRSGGIIFQGPTGTGKSFAARVLANHANAPLLNLQITYGTSIEDLIGMFVPNDKGSGGKWTFVEGPLLKAYYQGYQIVIEEINYGQPGVNAKLNEFTDGTPRITVNGKTYAKHPNFVVYMTMNPGYEGTEVLNVALKNRFQIVDVPALSKAEFTKRLQSYSKSLGHQLNNDFCGTLYDFAAYLEKEASTSKWHENVKFSIRNAQRLCDAILLKKRSFKEFCHAMAVEYINALSTDNDNSAKLQDYKKSSTLQEELKKIYDFYDFAETKTVDPAEELEAFFSEDVAGEGDTPESRTKKIDDLMSRFS